MSSFSKFSFGGQSYDVKDALAGKSLSLTGDTLNLLDSNDLPLSSVTLASAATEIIQDTNTNTWKVSSGAAVSSLPSGTMVFYKRPAVSNLLDYDITFLGVIPWNDNIFGIGQYDINPWTTMPDTYKYESIFGGFFGLYIGNSKVIVLSKLIRPVKDYNLFRLRSVTTSDEIKEVLRASYKSCIKQVVYGSSGFPTLTIQSMVQSGGQYETYTILAGSIAYYDDGTFAIMVTLDDSDEGYYQSAFTCSLPLDSVLYKKDNAIYNTTEISLTLNGGRYEMPAVSDIDSSYPYFILLGHYA